MSQILNSMHEGNCFSSPRVFEKLLEKPYFIFKMTGPAMVRPASSDFWKAPYKILGKCPPTPGTPPLVSVVSVFSLCHNPSRRRLGAKRNQLKNDRGYIPLCSGMQT